MANISDTLKAVYPLATNFYIEIFDRKEIVLTGDIEITELDDSVLKLKCGEHGVNFFGKNFKIRCYTSEGIRLCGTFEKIEFF